MTRRWKAVVALITGGGNAAEVATAATRAAEQTLRDVSKDPALIHAFWLLTQIPLAAREQDFAAALHDLDLDVSNRPNLIEISSAMIDAVRRAIRAEGSPNDLSEMATITAAESLTIVASNATESLFGTTYAADETKAALRRLSTTANFPELAIDFVSRLMRRILDYYLGRELPNHVGKSRRMPSLKDHQAFDDAIARHCREACLIIHNFSGDWFSKANYEGGVTSEKTRRFIHVAFNKLLTELSIRGDAHA